MGLRRILVGVDFSDDSNLAIDHAWEIARREAAELVLVHAQYVPGSA